MLCGGKRPRWANSSQFRRQEGVNFRAEMGRICLERRSLLKKKKLEACKSAGAKVFRRQWLSGKTVKGEGRTSILASKGGLKLVRRPRSQRAKMRLAKKEKI